MSTLLLRLAAPMQSWGANSKFEIRSTERSPTKSGVIGLVAAALGRRRDKSIEDLKKLNFGLRIDKEGVLLRDYHTAKSSKDTYITQRYYLCDAIFLIGLEGKDEFLQQLEEAITHPMFPLFLGRRSCPAEGKISLGIRYGKNLLESLNEEPWLSTARHAYIKKDSGIDLRIITDAQPADGVCYFKRDLPISFNQTRREYAFRRISNQQSVVKVTGNAPESSTFHDPISELEGL